MKIVICYRTVRPISAFDFYNNLNRIADENDNVDNVWDFLEPWVRNTGYPVLHVGWRSENVVLLSQVSLSHKKISVRNVIL